MKTQHIDESNVIGSAASSATVRGDRTVIASTSSAQLPIIHTEVNLQKLIINGTTYTVEERIADSGESEVFRINDGQMQFAFKYYYRQYKPKDEITSKLKGLLHPDIIGLMDYGFYQQRFFEISEFAHGGDLTTIMPVRELDKIEEIVRETVNALYYCHEHGIIHRDIKPQNIFFRSADKTDIAIGDFGIASNVVEGKELVRTTTARTSLYAAPELFTNIAGKTTIEKSVDYYALGITLLHLWFGRDPFENVDEFGIMRLKIEGKVLFPDGMHERVKTLIKGLLTVSPQNRWGYDEVQKWLKGEVAKPAAKAQDESPEEIRAKMNRWYEAIRKGDEKVINRLLEVIRKSFEMIKQGNFQSIPYLSALYLDEEDLPRKDLPVEILFPLMDCFSEGANHGDAAAECSIGWAHCWGVGISLDTNKGVDYLLRASDKGNATAMCFIGVYYRGVLKDYSQALRWYLKAAEKGNRKAMNYIGVMYRRGEGVSQDNAQAMRWYKKAAEKGESAAMNNIGAMYDNGGGVSQDHAQAMRWYKKAAEKGYSTAMSNIGWMYKKGEGVPQDYAQAMKWFQKAAEKGDSAAMNNIGWMYDKGEGVPLDYVQAMRWYKKAAEKGNSGAMNNIGMMYYIGEGVPQDYAMAKEWLQKAADLGEEQAQENLRELSLILDDYYNF